VACYVDRACQHSDMTWTWTCRFARCTTHSRLGFAIQQVLNLRDLGRRFPLSSPLPPQGARNDLCHRSRLSSLVPPWRRDWALDLAPPLVSVPRYALEMLQ
jgi:hypothetical protein